MSKTAEEVIGYWDWTPAYEALRESGSCTLRFVKTTRGIEAEVFVSSPAEKSEFRVLSGAHCATCQCNKLNAEPPSPGNSLSKSWHMNAAKGPPK
jgi:hypothetical protein